ncbi:hypothetical protein UFOVP181_288 [uncultured Caudovirales phage]|uniref:Uncharacterized protein n=1 Tax=uncultured Caudovirales phage TaxID=2100421 RepID=A0A6J7WEA2_9CAUD|nr:hypothetical protein UFOVP57_351 [uncultured Caudovirales phage]CAB5209021.1 hypothetical protein UFOVP181_288 [uncultured Caudovirales phage]
MSYYSSPHSATSIVGGGSATDTITLTNTGAGSSHTILGGGGAGSSTISYTGAGLAGTGLTYNTATTSWAAPTTNFNDGTTPVMTIPHGSSTIQIEKEATLDVKGNVKINGVDLEERLKTIETRLQIPTRDVTMEAKHPKLAELYKEYMKELEKYKTWDRIKGEDE